MFVAFYTHTHTLSLAKVLFGKWKHQSTIKQRAFHLTLQGKSMDYFSLSRLFLEKIIKSKQAQKKKIKICKNFGWENKSGHGNSSGRSLFFFFFFFVGTEHRSRERRKRGGGLCARASSRRRRSKFSTCTTSSGTKASRQDALINELLAETS